MLEAVEPLSGYTPITPTRVLDTRTPGSSPAWAPVANQNAGEKVLDLGPGSKSPVKLPSGTTAVVFNLTVVSPSHPGFLSVEPDDSVQPTTSAINFAAGQTLANLVTAPVSPDGHVILRTGVSDLNVLADVEGYYSPAGTGKFAPVNPVRLLDTRTNGSTLGTGGTAGIQITGQNGIPADATAVVVNLTTVGSSAGGYFTAYASGTAKPATSNINFGPGDILSNQAVVPVGADGKITLYNFAGRSDAVVDLAGYYSPTAADLFRPIMPSRLLDTRSGTSIGPAQSIGLTNLPAGADAVVLNVTAAKGDLGGFLTLYPHGIDRPLASNINFGPGAVLSSHATVAVGKGGQVDLYNHSGHTDAIADLYGYFSKS